MYDRLERRDKLFRDQSQRRWKATYRSRAATKTRWRKEAAQQLEDFDPECIVLRTHPMKEGRCSRNNGYRRWRSSYLNHSYLNNLVESAAGRTFDNVHSQVSKALVDDAARAQQNNRTWYFSVLALEVRFTEEGEIEERTWYNPRRSKLSTHWFGVTWVDANGKIQVHRLPKRTRGFKPARKEPYHTDSFADPLIKAGPMTYYGWHTEIKQWLRIECRPALPWTKDPETGLWSGEFLHQSPYIWERTPVKHNPRYYFIPPGKPVASAWFTASKKELKKYNLRSFHQNENK